MICLVLVIVNPLNIIEIELEYVLLLYRLISKFIKIRILTIMQSSSGELTVHT
jgi:hypothetical protein